MELFKDNKGQWSMTRALTAFVVMVIVLTWAIVCVKKGQLLDFGESNAAVVIGMIGGKALQRFGEK